MPNRDNLNGNAGRPRRRTANSSTPNTGRPSTRHTANGEREQRAASQRSAQRSTRPTGNPRLQSPARESARSQARPSVKQHASTSARRQTGQNLAARPSASSQSTRKPEADTRSSNVVGTLLKALIYIVLVIVAFAAGGIGYYVATTPESFNIKVNYEIKTIDRFTSINSLVEEGIASPVPGDHLAVDGSVLVKGGGVPYHATVNGEEPRFTFLPLKEGDIVEISDGEDTIEEFKATEHAVEPDKVEDGVGAIHAYVDGVEGVAEVRTGKESGITAEVVVTPAQPTTFYKYNADTGSDKVIALTFDDGPWDGTTDDVLDILDRYGVKATFFTIGDQIEGHEDSILRMYNAGHQICTHSWSHAEGSGQGVNLTYMTKEEQLAEVTKGLEAIEAVTGVEASKVFRAPGGNYTGDIVWTLQGHVAYEIGWNIDTADWTQPGADAIAGQIMNATSGQIVLMHDGGGDRTQTVRALEIAIPYLQERGYTFVTMDELIAYNRPIDMMPSGEENQEPDATAPQS